MVEQERELGGTAGPRRGRPGTQTGMGPSPPPPLTTPERPERCCGTCRWWTAAGATAGAAAWCPLWEAALPPLLTHVALSRLRAGGGRDDGRGAVRAPSGRG